MKLKDLYKKDKTVLSFEVFPPKNATGTETVYRTLDELKPLSPDFISVTYGAGGSSANKLTGEITSYIKNNLKIESMAHLTCIDSSNEDLDTILNNFKDRGIDNILALRGDKKLKTEEKEEFKYASDLINVIKNYGGFGISAACYPEGHIEAPDIISDIKNLKNKVQAGAETLISQMFFDNELFYNFREKTQLAGINVPISTGIMPLNNKKQIEFMVSLCGASLPQKFVKMISRYENKPEALEDAGIAYAVDQLVDLISNGVDGVHIYIMNKPHIAKKICDNLRSLL